MCVFPWIRANFVDALFNPFTWSCVSAILLWCGAHLQLSRTTPNGDRACRCAFFHGSVHIFHLHFQLNRVALSVGELPLWCGAHRRCVSRVLEEFLVSSMNSLGGSCGSKHWSRAPKIIMRLHMSEGAEVTEKNWRLIFLSQCPSILYDDVLWSDILWILIYSLWCIHDNYGPTRMTCMV